MHYATLNRRNISALTMETLSQVLHQVEEVNSVKLHFKDLPQRELRISAVGQCTAEGWVPPKLKLRSYDFPPIDGIYDFDFIAQAPKALTPGLVEAVIAVYKWSNYPENLRGIRIHGSENSLLKMIQL